MTWVASLLFFVWILHDYSLDKRRLPRKYAPTARRKMTLIAGFVSRDGLLICADMEEVGAGASKPKTTKLFYRGF